MADNYDVQIVGSNSSAAEVAATIRCRQCEAPPKSVCFSSVTGKPRFFMHKIRIKDAWKMMTKP